MIYLLKTLEQAQIQARTKLWYFYLHFVYPKLRNSLSGQVFGKREWGKVWGLFRFCKSFELSNLGEKEGRYFVKLRVSWNLPAI